MLKNSLRALCAASLIVAPLIAATPAHAVTACTVNGMPASGPTVTGTPFSDFISCSSVDPGDTVNALGGNDRILLTGPVNGSVLGGDGRDSVSLTQSGSVGAGGVIDGQTGNDALSIRGPVAGTVNGGAGNDSLQVGVNTGTVDGGAGNDFLQVGVNNGIVDGGANFDVCMVGAGNPPINCEFTF